MTVVRVWNHQTGESYVPGEEPERKGRIQIIRDFQDSVQNPVDGKHYSSRRHYMDALRAHGVEVVGNDHTGRRRARMPTAAPDVHATLQQLRSR